MVHRLWPLLIALGIVAALGLSVRAGPSTANASVAIVDYAFQPDPRTISQGDTVIWTNTGVNDHTVGSDTESWDFETIPPGDTFSVTFTEAGTFPYRCTLHTGMTGTVIVVGPTPTATNTAVPRFLPMVSNPPTTTPSPTALPATSTPPPAGAIPNGTFELGQATWYEYGSPYDVIVTKAVLPKPVLPHSGEWAAWLGGVYDTTIGVEQEVTVSASRPYISYWYWAASADFCGYDEARVMIDNVIVDRLDLCADKNTNGWKRRTIDLGAYKSQTVLLSVEVSTDANRNSNWFVDDFAFVSRP